MNNLDKFKFFTEKPDTGKSNEWRIPNKSEILKLEVSGNFASCDIEVKGTIDRNSSELVPLASITALYDVPMRMLGRGIYTYDVSLLDRVQLEIHAVDGGSISVFGKVGNPE